jgi:octaprenyl-diphosphate synthase
MSVPTTLSQIQAPVAEELKAFEVHFRGAMRSRVVLLDRIMDYIVKRKGKQIRPLLVFLSAGACGPITDRTFRGASLIELLHTATLVHDDVVDDAALRRGFFSVNALWKNKIAVLVGDYLLSRGLLLSVENGDFDLLRQVSQAVREMSEGELLQMEKARKLDIEEDVYFDIIRQKTASLMASCCAVGACSAGASGEILETFEQFGQKMGIAFQIKDDLFDYGKEEIGKPLGIDIKEKKMTLPLIHALKQGSSSDRRRIIGLIRNSSHKSKAVEEVIAFVVNTGGLVYAKDVMNQYRVQALRLLHQLPDSIYRQSLEGLVNYTIEREK